MIAPMDVVIFLAGLVLLGIVLWDIFQSIVVPRPTPGRLRLGRYLIPPTWRLWRAIGTRGRSPEATDWFLGLYAPGAAIILFVVWLAFIVLADGLMLWALRTEVTPQLGTFFDALYFAGTSVLTLGFGEIIASGGVSRVVVLVAAATGLGVVALVITFIFSLFANYQRREVLVVTLSARAKSPPSAVTLLETHARLEMIGDLPALFREWEHWAAEVLDSHVAYPLLGYFRSSHDSISWNQQRPGRDRRGLRGRRGGVRGRVRAPRAGGLHARATRTSLARVRAGPADVCGPARGARGVLGHAGAALERRSRRTPGSGHPPGAARQVGAVAVTPAAARCPNRHRRCPAGSGSTGADPERR